MTFKITGLKEFQKQLENLERKTEALNREHEVSFAELFTASFMVRNTNFDSMEALIEAGGFNVETADDFEAIPDQERDEHLAKTTRFANWQEMMDEASSEWVKKQLGI